MNFGLYTVDKKGLLLFWMNQIPTELLRQNIKVLEVALAYNKLFSDLMAYYDVPKV